MIGAVPPDYAATFYGVIDEDAALAAADAERVAEQAEFEQDSRAELEGVDEAGEEIVRAIEEEPDVFSDSWPRPPMELERCLYLADAATCRARMARSRPSSRRRCLPKISSSYEATSRSSSSVRGRWTRPASDR